VAKLTEKQKQFLQKHNMWNPDKDKSTLGILEKSSFQDFFRRKEKVEIELARLPNKDKKQELTRKLQAAEEKAKNKQFKEAYNDLKQVKIEARREANGYSDSLSLQDLGQQIDTWGLEGDNVSQLVTKLETGKQVMRNNLRDVGKASDFASLEEAAEFLRDFKSTESIFRAAITGQKVLCGQLTKYLRENDPAKKLQDLSHQASILQKEQNQDVSELQGRVELLHVKFIHQGKTLAAGDVQQCFDQFLAEIDTGIRQRKDVSKFQKRDKDGEKFSDDTLMRNPTAWNYDPTELDKVLGELAKGNSKSEFDNVVFQLKDLESALKGEKAKNSPEFQKELQLRRDKALRALQLLDQRDAKRFQDTELNLLIDTLGDQTLLTKTQDAPKTTQPLTSFSSDSVVSALTKLPTNLKKTKEADIQEVRKEVKELMEQLLTDELKKEDSDLVFDLGLKTKEEFVQDLAHAMGIDTTSKKCSKEEKFLLDNMAEQMVETVREKYPNKAGNAKVTIPTKDGKNTEVPTEFVMGGKKYTGPKYLASGGVGDVLRYQEDGTDPPKYTVVKTLQKQDKRDDMVRELKLHRQANGGENGASSPYVVEMQGAIQGQSGEIYMAMEFAEGGDLNDMGYTLAQATLSGSLSGEARDVLTQHLLRQAVLGMKQVQDNNMTHHDIKGMNYLIGGDGTVKVADFGSGQVGDEKGEVPSNAPHMITTPGYKAPELGGPNRVTGKADTYSLGVMLNKLSGPMQGHGASTGKGPDKPLTALDKLKTAMMDEDPNKRPTLEAVLQTSYMTDMTANYDQDKIDNLMKAVMGYNKHVASKAKKELRLMVYHQGQLDSLQNKKAAAKTLKEREEVDQKIAEELKEIEELRKKVETLLKEDDSKPYVEGLQKASEELVRPSEGPKLDVAKIRFKDEYDQIVDNSQIPANEQLLKLLTDVDQAGDPSTKKDAALKALEQAKKLEANLVQITKTTKVEKAKMTASKLATDIRKLQQALKELAK